MSQMQIHTTAPGTAGATATSGTHAPGGARGATSQALRQQDYAAGQIEWDAQGINRLSMDLWAPGKEDPTLERTGAITALTAQLREQGNVLRQGARNLDDARLLLDTASSGMMRIGEAIGSMRGVVEGVSAGTVSEPQAMTMLDDMSGEIDSIIQNTRWQGIAPLDASSWGRQPSIPAVRTGTGSGPVPLALEDQSAAFSGRGIRENIDLTTPDTRKKSSELLTDMESRATTIGTAYGEQATGYGNLSVALQSQADIMDTAIKNYASGQNPERAMPTAESLSQTLASQVAGHIVRNRV